MAIDSLDGAAGAQLLTSIVLADVAVFRLGGVCHISELDNRQAERTVLDNGRGSGFGHAEHASAPLAKDPRSNAFNQLGQLCHDLFCFLKALVAKKLTAYDRHIKTCTLGC